MMSDGSVSALVNPCARRKKKFKPKNRSPGISPQVKDWNGEIQNAAAPRRNSAIQKTFKGQRNSASAVSHSSAHGSTSAGVNLRTTRKKYFKQINSSPGIPPQEEDWDYEISLIVKGHKDETSVASRDWTLKHLLTGTYTPAVHHVQPVRWVHKNIPIEPDQFADADEPPGMPPQVEDRDCESQDAAKKTTPVTADGHKDETSVASWDWTLKHLLTGTYTPAVHHVQPVRWVRNHIPIEPDQFADADE